MKCSNTNSHSEHECYEMSNNDPSTVSISVCDGVPLSDKEQLEAMFARSGIIVECGSQGELIVGSRYVPQQDGYGGFYARFKFDGSGALTSLGIWE